MKVKVCAIIVTRNRLKSLQRTVGSLMQQTYPISYLIIVDNDSADGTKEFLMNLKLPITLKTIFQSNLGGAGGFNAGLTLFKKLDADWCWLMDDDGWADSNALDCLQPAIFSEVLWRNSLVVNEKNHEQLAFSLCAEGIWTNNRAVASNAKSPIRTCNPFNGTLLHKKLIDAIGLPISKLFIKGDEAEYHRRAVRSGYLTETFVNSCFYHPAHRELDIVEIDDSRLWTYYYKVRNINASGDKTGLVTFDKNASYNLAKEYTFEIVASFLKGKMTLYASVKRLMYIWTGVFAAWLNYAFKWFVPKNK